MFSALLESITEIGKVEVISVFNPTVDEVIRSLSAHKKKKNLTVFFFGSSVCCLMYDGKEKSNGIALPSSDCEIHREMKKQGGVN